MSTSPSSSNKASEIKQDKSPHEGSVDMTVKSGDSVNDINNTTVTSLDIKHDIENHPNVTSHPKDQFKSKTNNPQDDLIQMLQITHEKWSSFLSSSNRSKYEKAATNAREQRDASLSARKSLAEATKAFKKCVKNAEGGSEGSVDLLTKECRSIVKAYQEGIDNLTRRCKSSDSSFLELHRLLFEANNNTAPDSSNIFTSLPDPSPVLLTAMEHLENKGGQVQHLLRGMEEMHQEMEELGGRHVQEMESAKQKMDDLKSELEIETRKTEKLQKEIKNMEREHAKNEKGSRNEREELLELRKEVAEYEAEFKGLKNQDVTIKNLRQKIENMEISRDEELRRELDQAREELAQTEGRRAIEALEREAIMERKLKSVELELRAERAGREATQESLLEADEGASEREAAWEAQRRILVDDADRLREMLQVITKERDELNLRVQLSKNSNENDAQNLNLSASSTTSNNNNGNDSKNLISLSEQDHHDLSNIGMAEIALERKAYQAEVSELTLTVSSLRDELKAKDNTVSNLQISMQDTLDSLENERSNLQKKVISLEEVISNAPSVESINEMKRELRILKQLEYNVVDIDAETKEPEMTINSSNANQGEELELVLVAKLRKIESDLLKEKREKAQSIEECTKIKEELSLALKANEDANNLTSRLEADLEKAIAASSTISSASKKEISLSSEPILLNTKADPKMLEKILDPSISVRSATENANAANLQTNSQKSIEDKMQDDHSVATIVMAQRDRLRVRCDALEAERDGFKRELQVQINASESLKSDNSKLYEKVRYLQNYTKQNGGTISSGSVQSGSSGAYLRRGTSGKTATSSSMNDQDIDLEALEQRYEASVDPFRQFNRAERQRKLREMSPMERIVYMVAKTFLGSKEMRTFLFFYVLAMHFLVFVTTYHWSHERGCDFHSHPDLNHFHGGPPVELSDGVIDTQKSLGGS